MSDENDIKGPEVPLRDDPLDPLDPRDVLTATILKRLHERDEITTRRLGLGLLSPKEVARVAAEVALEERA